MRQRSVVAAAVFLAALAGGASAQSPENPNIVFTLSAGGSLAGGPLWTIARQPAAVAPAAVDTLALSRRLGRLNLTVALAGTYFRSPHLGYTVEASFLGLDTKSTCSPVGAFAPDSDQVNAQACANLDGHVIRTSAVAFQAGLVLRAGGQGSHFYLRALGGFAILGESSVRAAGAAVAVVPVSDTASALAPVIRIFLDDNASHALTWAATLGGGTTVAIAPGTYLGLEVSDRIIALPVPAGPGDVALDPQRLIPVAPVRWRTLHLPTLSIVMELMLEQEHRRRY